MKRAAAYNLLDRVRQELDAARFALRHTLALLRENPQAVIAAQTAGVTDGELRRCETNIEVTFTLRFFAEFEGILRDYWAAGLGRTTEPQIGRLLNAIAARRDMDLDTRSAAHSVREYRNDIVHESLRDARLSFPDCARALGRYLSWLPPQW